MSVIRAGHFVEFKGGEALLLDTDRQGLARLESWARTLAEGASPRALEECTGVHLQRGLRVVAEVASSDIGLAHGQAGVLSWRRTSLGWAQIADQLAALRVANRGTSISKAVPIESCRLPAWASTATHGGRTMPANLRIWTPPSST